MKATLAIFGILAGLLSFNPALAQTTQTGLINSVIVNTGSNRFHMSLAGDPTFNGGGCPYHWTGNSLDEYKFMVFMYPMLVSAINNAKEVVVTVSGCEGTYPKIIGIEYPPRTP